MAAPLKNIAFVGATGYVGKPTLRALAGNGLHKITVISRTSSTSKIPEYNGVTTKFGDYDDEAFMQSVLAGQDVLIIMLAFLAMGQQDKLITAAAKAGVKYIIPSEYMLDTSNSRICDAVPLMKKCQKDHERIQALGMKHISVVCNLWLDFVSIASLKLSVCSSLTHSLDSRARPSRVQLRRTQGKPVRRQRALQSLHNHASWCWYRRNAFPPTIAHRCRVRQFVLVHLLVPSDSRRAFPGHSEGQRYHGN